MYMYVYIYIYIYTCTIINRAKVLLPRSGLSRRSWSTWAQARLFHNLSIHFTIIITMNQ